MLHPWWPEGLLVHPHLVFELLAYTVGFQLFRVLRRRRGDPVTDAMTRAWLLAAAVVGAAAGAKGLYLLEDPAQTWAHRTDLAYLTAGRSIVGGLLGGLFSVEGAKRWMGVTVATGDLYVLPLCVGMIVGRMGCFLSGVSDGTHGIETTLPWGMDLGDGLVRHPTALYEIAFFAVLAIALARWRPTVAGDSFKAWMVAYLLWRLWIETLKTQPFPWAGLSGIQLACLVGLAWYAVIGVRRLRS